MDTEKPKTVEYETSGEEYWNVREWPALESFFGLKEVELPVWHDMMAGQGRAWEIICRLFGVGDLLDPGADGLREWSRDDIAGKYGIAVDLVDEEISNAVKQWELRRAQAEVKQGVAAITEEELDHLTRFSSGEGMNEELISRLLKEFNFDHIQRDPVLRAQTASRIISLKQWLNSPHTRTGARDLIRMEISMHTMDSLLVGYRNKLADELFESEANSDADNDGKVDGLYVKISNLEKQLREISKAHADKQQAIGANDLDMTARKRIYVETVSFLIDQCREFESDPENWKPDGIFTAAEINWLMEPSGERDAQYRPDIMMVADEAVKAENLWNPRYKPTKVTRRVCQELAQIVNTARRIPKDAEPLPERDEEDEEDGITDDVATLPIDDGNPADAAPVVARPAASAAGFF